MEKLIKITSFTGYFERGYYEPNSIVDEGSEFISDVIDILPIEIYEGISAGERSSKKYKFKFIVEIEESFSE